MRLLIAQALLIAALAGCGSAKENSAMNDSKAVAAITLTSSAFQDGGPIPSEFTCDGAGMQPPLSWGEPPPGTKSFVLIVDDPDAPGGTFRHWGAFDIPASARSMAASGYTEVENDFGKKGYGGPCPPKGHGPHNYRFKLLALDVASLGVQPDVKIAALEREAEKHLLGRAELTGTYERR